MREDEAPQTSVRVIVKWCWRRVIIDVYMVVVSGRLASRASSSESSWIGRNA